MDVKEWLSRGRKLDAEIEQLKKAKAEAFACACGGAVDTSAERVQGGEGNGMERKLLNYVEYDILISKRIVELLAVKREILECINYIQNPTYRTVLITYYVNCRTWEMVAEEMGYDLRWVYRLHIKALKAIESHYKSMI